jgi:hypothetical protein
MFEFDTTSDSIQQLVIIEGYKNVLLLCYLDLYALLPSKIVNFNKVIFDKMPIVFKALH